MEFTHLLEHGVVALKLYFISIKYWDETLAAIAQHYAETCPRTHDQFNARFNPSKYSIRLGWFIPDF